MPVRVVYMDREAGEAVGTEAAVAWLRRGGVVLSPRERKYLGVFLMSVDSKYGFLRQGAFMEDLRAMIAPYVEGGSCRTAGVQQARESFQQGRFMAKLGKMALAGDGRVAMEFVPKPDPSLDLSRTLIVSEKHVGLSQGGRTNLYTGGFAGCLGMLLSPTTGRGGVLAHIAQQGKRPEVSKRTYLIDSIETILRLASNYWTEFNMVLLIGDVEYGDIEFRELPLLIRGKCPNGHRLKHIQDLRSYRERAGQFLFDSHHKVLYLLGGGPSLDSSMAAAEFTDEMPSMPLTIASSTKGMTLHLCE